MSFRETSDGFIYSNNSVLVFFGKKSCTLERLHILYPEFVFRGVKQTHSNISIQSFDDSGSIEADAHWTHEKNVALLIKTADCVPIMILQPESETVMAIHAGWRGVAHRITPLTVEKLSSPYLCEVFIGPHIMQNSFQVQDDVKELLVNSTDASPEQFLKTENGKMYIDLENMIKNQIAPFKITNIKSTKTDTKTNPDFHSYRRDSTNLIVNGQRNISFICLLT